MLVSRPNESLSALLMPALHVGCCGCCCSPHGPSPALAEGVWAADGAWWDSCSESGASMVASSGIASKKFRSRWQSMAAAAAAAAVDEVDKWSLWVRSVEGGGGHSGKSGGARLATLSRWSSRRGRPGPPPAAGPPSGSPSDSMSRNTVEEAQEGMSSGRSASYMSPHAGPPKMSENAPPAGREGCSSFTIVYRGDGLHPPPRGDGICTVPVAVVVLAAHKGGVIKVGR